MIHSLSKGIEATKGERNEKKYFSISWGKTILLVLGGLFCLFYVLILLITHPGIGLFDPMFLIMMALFCLLTILLAEHLYSEMKKSSEGISRSAGKKEMLLAVGILFYALIIVLLIVLPPVGPYMGEEPPEFSFTLVDNGENDYIDIKFIRAGTGLAWMGFESPLSLEKLQIRIGDNYVFRLPPGKMFEGEKLRFHFHEDVVKKGKVYKLSIIAYWIDNLYYDELLTEVSCK